MLYFFRLLTAITRNFWHDKVVANTPKPEAFMVLPIPPRTFICQNAKCNWRKSLPATSDSMITGHDHFTHCPKCGGNLKVTKKIGLVTQLSKIINFKN